MSYSGAARPPIFADLNCDGAQEVLVPVFGLGILVYTAAGAPFPGWSFQGSTVLDEKVRVGDITGDGVPEILYAKNPNLGILEVVDTSGAFVSPFPLDISGLWPGSRIDILLLADVVPGGGLEIILGSEGYSIGPESTVVILDQSGEPISGWPKVFETFVSVAADDLDGDGFSEIVIGTRNSCLCGTAPCYVYRGDGSGFPGWPAIPVGGSEASMWLPMIADMDGDGAREIIGTTTSHLYIMNSDGTMFRPAIPLVAGPRQPSIGDLDLDGRKEIIVGGIDLQIVDIDEGVVLSTSGTGYQDFQSSISIADTDGDGFSEIVAMSSYPQPWAVHVFDIELNELVGFPVSAFSATQVQIEKLTLADLDADGDLELGFSYIGSTLVLDLANVSGAGLWVQWQSYYNGVTASASSHSSTGPVFLRGDVDGSGVVDVSDVLGALSWMFGGGMSDGACRDAADANDDGRVDVADAVFTLSALFEAGMVTLPAVCGFDSTVDMLECVAYFNCP